MAKSDENTVPEIENPESAAQDKVAGADPKMEVSVAKMESIMDMLSQLQSRDKERDEEIAILRDSVSRQSLAEAEDKRTPKGPPIASLMVYQGRVVTSWKMTKNEMVYHPQNLQVPVSENLQIQLNFMDEKDSVIIPYVDFIRTKDRAQVSKVGEMGVNWIVEFENLSISREQLTVDPQFLNP